jgi:hypothetical protein
MILLMLYLQIGGSATQFTFGDTTGSGSGSPPPQPARTLKGRVTRAIFIFRKYTMQERLASIFESK